MRLVNDLGLPAQEISVIVMPDYDFHILQPNEFECLTRDLLQKREKIFIESFTEGRDGGIDMRFASASPRKTTIVQAKRYKDFQTLFKKLKEEASKVVKLNPKRYIISTSVGLTPENKNAIRSLFSPFILSTDDILGRDDLNNLLGQYKEIEEQYYKLWISSTAIMDRILHRRIENWSGFEKDRIQEEVATYVMNDSFDEAMSVLLKNRYVIISGIPGIGKTTLARMLVYKLLGENYEEVIRISTMEDAAEKLIKSRRQVFFFDDFLGANFFRVNEDGFENKVIAFIDAVKRAQDKLFILATREYILSSAMRTLEGFSIRNIEIAKCTIALSNYTESIRARILYNHLASANLPEEYIRQLLTGKQYLKIIKHPNFNPRIIEAFLNKRLYLQVSPSEFVNQFLDFFAHPSEVWRYAFNNMTALAQYALLVRMTMGNGPVYLKDWYIAVKSFVQGTKSDLNLTISEIIWEDVLKVMEGTFVLSSRKSGAMVVTFHNPSVFDFLFDKASSMSEIQAQLIETAAFSDQVYRTFADRDSIGRIKIVDEARSSIIKAFKAALSNVLVCELDESYSSYYRRGTNKVSYMLHMLSAFPDTLKTDESLVSDEVTQELLEDGKIDLGDRISLLDHLDESAIGKLDIERLAYVAYYQADWSYDFVNIVDFLQKTERGREFLNSNEMLQRVEESLEAELESATNEDECNQIGDAVSYLSSCIPGLSKSIWDGAVDEAKSRFPGEPDYEVDEDWARESYYQSREPEDKTYGEMFSSLLADC